MCKKKKRQYNIHKSCTSVFQDAFHVLDSFLRSRRHMSALHKVHQLGKLIGREVRRSSTAAKRRRYDSTNARGLHERVFPTHVATQVATLLECLATRCHRTSERLSLVVGQVGSMVTPSSGLRCELPRAPFEFTLHSWRKVCEVVGTHALNGLVHAHAFRTSRRVSVVERRSLFRCFSSKYSHPMLRRADVATDRSAGSRLLRRACEIATRVYVRQAPLALARGQLMCTWFKITVRVAESFSAITDHRSLVPPGSARSGLLIHLDVVHPQRNDASFPSLYRNKTHATPALRARSYLTATGPIRNENFTFNGKNMKLTHVYCFGNRCLREKAFREIQPPNETWM